MNNSNPLKLDEDTKKLVLEVSALSGYAQNVVKEVFEYMLMSWAVKIADKPDEYASLSIPYLGTVSVKFAGDKVLPTGELDTQVDVFADLSDAFRKLIGDIHDEGYSELIPIMSKKIEQAIMVASNSLI